MGVNDCKRILDDSRDEALAEQSSTRKTVRSESGSSVSVPLLCRNDVLSVLRRQMAISSSQDLFSRSPSVQKETRHSAHTLYGHSTIRKMQKSMMESGSCDLWWNSETYQLPRSFPGTVQIYSDKTATLVIFNAYVAYLAETAWLTFTEKE